MGVVYEAEDDRLGRAIALKVIRPDTVNNSVARERFWREARLAARINHPCICQIYEVGEAEQQLFMAMERLDGESLSARLDRGAVLLGEAVRACNAAAFQLLESCFGIEKRSGGPEQRELERVDELAAADRSVATRHPQILALSNQVIGALARWERH
jgi:hypothetical protein